MTAELDGLVKAIDARLASIHAQIASLEVARSVLSGVNAVGGRHANGHDDHHPRQRRQPAARHRPRPRRPGPDLSPGELERLLETDTTGGGISAAALARQAGVPRAMVIARLSGLERDGRVRGLDRGRARRWRLVPDEERIALRAAELERQRRVSE